MKKRPLISAAVLIALIFSQSKLHASVLHLGLPGSPYNTLDGAIIAAAAGDTIYVYPGKWQSTSNNGYAVIKKNLTFISYGSNYGNAGLQNITGNCAIYIQLSSGSAGSRFQGISGLYLCTDNSAISGVAINRCDCIIGGSGNFQYDNWVITQSALQVVGYLNYRYTNGYFTKLDIENCIITNYILENTTASASTGILKNNVFTNTADISSNFNFNSNAFTAINNIFSLSQSTAQYNFREAGSMVYRNNIANRPGIIPQGVPLTNKVVTGIIFTSATAAFDAGFTVDKTSVAYSAADNAGQCGIFGGSYPFKLNNIAPIPAFYKLTAPSTVTGTTYTLTFSVRSNN